MSHLLVNPIKAIWIDFYESGDTSWDVECEIVGYDYLNYPIVELVGGSLRIPVTYSELLVF